MASVPPARREALGAHYDLCTTTRTSAMDAAASAASCRGHGDRPVSMPPSLLRTPLHQLHLALRSSGWGVGTNDVGRGRSRTRCRKEEGKSVYFRSASRDAGSLFERGPAGSA
eukprot:1391964-Prymnesium_polylepis.1